MKKIKPRLTFTVNFKVLMQIARRYKRLSALRTAERSLPCMDTHVKLQNVRLSNACWMIWPVGWAQERIIALQEVFE